MSDVPKREDPRRIISEITGLLAQAEAILDEGQPKSFTDGLLLCLRFTTLLLTYENATSVIDKAYDRVFGFLRKRKGSNSGKLLSRKSRLALSKEFFSLDVSDRGFYFFRAQPSKRTVDLEGVLVLELTSPAKKARCFFFYDEKTRTLYFVRSHVIERFNRRAFNNELSRKEVLITFFQEIIHGDQTKILVGEELSHHLVSPYGAFLGHGFAVYMEEPEEGDDEPPGPEGRPDLLKVAPPRDFTGVDEEEGPPSYNLVTINTFIAEDMYFPNQKRTVRKVQSVQTKVVDLGNLDTDAA